MDAVPTYVQRAEVTGTLVPDSPQRYRQSDDVGESYAPSRRAQFLMIAISEIAFSAGDGYAYEVDICNAMPSALLLKLDLAALREERDVIPHTEVPRCY